MRNSFGSASFAVEDLPVPSWQEFYGMEEGSPQLNEMISIGGDLRTLFLAEQQPSSTRSSFFQMQADLYVSARLAKKTSLYVSKGLGNRFEAFAVVGLLPLNGYIKAGWFAPAYGLRMDDHNILTRSKTLFAFGGGQDAGIEVAFAPSFLTLTASVSNGASLDRDDNAAKALLGRVEGQILLAPVNVRVGGTYYNNAGTTGTTTLTGAFLTASVGGNLTILAEVDQKRARPNSGGGSTTSLISFVEADYVLLQGLDLKAGYEFYDPDTKYKTGSESRLVAGVEFFPIAGIEVRPVYIHRLEEPADRKDNQFIVMFHFFF
jgi:hypothetical protein